MKLNHFIKLTTSFLLVRSFQLVIVHLTPSKFDISSIQYQITSNVILNNVLNKLIHWDNVFFYKLLNRGPSFEHEWVFGPLWWRLVKSIPLPCDKFIIGVVLANVLNYFTMILIYELTKLKFDNLTKSFISGLLFIISPMGVFAMIPYSENLSNFFIVLGLYLYYQRSKLLYLTSSILFGLSVLTRSNTLIVGSLFLYDFISQKSIIALISGLIMGSSVFILNYIPYLEYCPNREVWCNNMIPSIYSFAQSHYWDVGFLRYWTMNNVFNFIIASPMLFLLFQSIKNYYTKDLKLTILASLHLILCVFFIHVQIVLRISGFIPLTYWYLSDLMLSNKGQNWILYLMIWIPLQTTLFSAFLPPA